jgi:pyruvate,water dikinase
MAICPGIVEGTARVIAGPESGDLHDGEILVRPYDRSGLDLAVSTGQRAVIDVGGPISHGAIVAREMGMPCRVWSIRAMGPS